MRNLLTLLLILGIAVPLLAEVPMDVPQGHWAYDAVKSLANKGFVLGYPDGSFLGDRTLTRYEFATIVKRILDNVDQELMKVKNQPPGATAPAAEITREDTTNVNNLVDEFKVELAVIGTRLDRVEATVEELRSKLERIDAAVSDSKRAVESAQADVKKLKKVTASGYIQARYQNCDYANDDVPNEDTFDTFLVRRARLKVTARPTERSTAVVEIDAGQNTVTVKDTYFQHAFGENSQVSPSFRIGQFKWPFGYEVQYSSSKRETPERALVFRRFFPGERDQGAKIMAAEESSFTWQLGAFNGTGIQKNSATDLNDAKDIVANVKWKSANLDIGMSGYYGRGVWQEFGRPATYLQGVPKIRYGADLQLHFDRLTLKAEYVRGKGVDQASPSWDQSTYVDGYYAQLGYDFTTKDTLVTRYSVMSQDPVNPQYGRRTDLEIGYLRWLEPNSRFKFFYRFENEEFAAFDNNGFASEVVVTY